jgi:hypothetical protein
MTEQRKDGTLNKRNNPETLTTAANYKLSQCEADVHDKNNGK